MTFRLLLSYWYFREADLRSLLPEWFPDGVEVFADSGAYSAKTQGVDISVDDYAAWIERHRDLFHVYANLDVIGDAREAAVGTWENQQTLERRGLSPLPVFHAGEPWEFLHRYLDAGYGYIALGGLVGRRSPTIMPWAVRCFRLAEGRAVFHGFGLTQRECVTSLPFYSVDSTTWTAGFRYRLLDLFDPATGRQVHVTMNQKGIYGTDGVARLIRSYGFDPADFADPQRYNRARTCDLSVASWQTLEVWLRRRFGEIHPPAGRRLPDMVSAPGLRLYLAETARTNLVTIGQPKELSDALDHP